MIELYMWGTANGLRASVALAESGLEHRVRKVDLTKGEQKKPEFLALNPAGQIPVMVDIGAAGGARLVLAQSGAIVLYVAEKSGKFLPKDGARRAAAYQWFMLGLSDVAAASGTVFLLENAAPEKSAKNVEFFKERLVKFFALVDQRLVGREFVADELSIADLTLYPNYSLRKPLLDASGSFANLHRWGAMMAARPGVMKGMNP